MQSEVRTVVIFLNVIIDGMRNIGDIRLWVLL